MAPAGFSTDMDQPDSCPLTIIREYMMPGRGPLPWLIETPPLTTTEPAGQNANPCTLAPGATVYVELSTYATFVNPTLSVSVGLASGTLMPDVVTSVAPEIERP